MLQGPGRQQRPPGPISSRQWTVSGLVAAAAGRRAGRALGRRLNTKFEGFALEGELQRWAIQQVEQPGGQFAATSRLPLVNQRTQYVDPHVQYPCPDSGVVCVVEITAAFWVRYQHAYFNLGMLGIKIGPRRSCVG